MNKHMYANYRPPVVNVFSQTVFDAVSCTVQYAVTFDCTDRINVAVYEPNLTLIRRHVQALILAELFGTHVSTTDQRYPLTERTSGRAGAS